MQDTQQRDAVDVFVGVDVGKGQHHAVALDRHGKRLYNKALPNDEAKLRALIAELKTHGRLLFVVDQPSTIGALPVAVARAEGVLVAYLPGLAMRRIADLHAGEAKTDARDAAIIAEAARSMPHTLRSLRLADEQLAELTMLCGFDDDLAAQVTQTSNRIRGLLTQIHPALRLVYPRRTSIQTRQQGAQARLVPIRLRGLARPRLASLLHAQGPAGQAPQPSAHRAGTATL
ncbi:transposase family protein [Burkholderia thailandensis MSMB121]|nr:transposase family protein [Burkholderia thailandensis MSMB121]KST71969.1 transposase [Burkholderia humptydooensis]